jgi:hypothetical protein
VDFANRWGHDLTPENFVSDEFNSHLTLTWNMLGAYENIAPVVDAFGGEGFFNDLETSFQNADGEINLREMVSTLNNRITVISSTKHPIDARSEQVAIVVPLSDSGMSHDKFFVKLKSLIGSDGEVLKSGDLEYVLIESNKEEVDELNIEIDPRFGSIDSGSQSDQEDEAGHEFFLFERRFITVTKGMLVVANNLDSLKNFAEGETKSTLANAADFTEMEAALSKFVDWELVSGRGFGRLSQELEVNYEMLRRGEIVGAQTALARILNEVFRDTTATDEEPRDQKLDSTTLPSDYAGVVAPYLGNSGWAMETRPDGWLLSGTVLKKKLNSEVVQKPTDNTRR